MKKTVKPVTYTPTPEQIVEWEAAEEAREPGSVARRKALRAKQDRLLALLGTHYPDTMRLSLDGPADLTLGGLRSMIWPNYEWLFDRLIADRE